MLTHNFQAASIQGDWQMPFLLSAKNLLGAEGWTDDEVVSLHISPDKDRGWDDYGIRRYGLPPAGERIASPIYQTTSSDGTNVVLLRDPHSVQVVVPATVMSRFGPGMVSLGVHFERLSTGQRVTLMRGRLPIVSVP